MPNNKFSKRKYNKLVRKIQREHKPLLQSIEEAFGPKKPTLKRRFLHKLGLIPAKDYYFVRGTLETIARDGENAGLLIHGNENIPSTRETLVEIARGAVQAADRRWYGRS